MKINPNTHALPVFTPPSQARVGGASFNDILNRHIQKNGIASLVKDAFADTKTEIINEIETIASDKPENIDMKTLDDLLNLLMA
jgi:hypothetical protein